MWPKIIFASIWVMFFALCYVLMQKQQPQSDTPVVQYLENYDGDTVRVNIPGWPDIIGRKISIRIAGIDTAEIRSKNECEQGMARKARSLVAQRLSNASEIRLRNLQRGKYFRIVADLEADGVNLGQELLSQGLAVPYGGGRKSKIDWCLPLLRVKK